MDEHKEANAAKTRIEIGVSNEAMETAAMTGEDWTTVITQRAREMALRKKLGVDLSPPAASAQAQPADPRRPNSPNSAEDDSATGDDDGAEQEEDALP